MSKPEKHVFATATDGAYENTVTGSGSTADPIRKRAIRNDIAEIDKTTIDTLVRKEWGCRQHVQFLPAEAMRKGYDLKLSRDGEDLDPEDVRKVADLLTDLGAFQAIRQSMEWMRQYGGAILIAHASESGSVEDEMGEEPKLVRIEVRSRHSVETPQSSDLEDDPSSPHFNAPRVWRLLRKAGAKGEGVELHRSRAWAFLGRRYQDDAVSAWRWPLSVLEDFEPAWNGYTHAMSETLAAVPRLAETRIGITGLFDQLAQASESEKSDFKDFMGAIAGVRSGQRILAFDKDAMMVQDAEVDIGGAIDLIKVAREHVGGASGLSESSFFGLRQTGLSSNDETGAERDDAQVVAMQTEHVIPCLDWLTGLALAHLGIEADTWEWRARPLREERPKEKADRELTEAQRREIDVSIGIADPHEARMGQKGAADSPYAFEDRFDEPEEPQDPEPPEDDNGPPEPPDEVDGEDEEEDESAVDESWSAPDGVRSAMRRGLRAVEAGHGGSGLERATIAQARRIANGGAVSAEWARKGNRFWARNERFLGAERNSPADVSAALWGGRAGMSWYRGVVRKLDAKKKD